MGREQPFALLLQSVVHKEKLVSEFSSSMDHTNTGSIQLCCSMFAQPVTVKLSSASPRFEGRKAPASSVAAAVAKSHDMDCLLTNQGAVFLWWSVIHYIPNDAITNFLCRFGLVGAAILLRSGRAETSNMAACTTDITYSTCTWNGSRPRRHCFRPVHCCFHCAWNEMAAAVVFASLKVISQGLTNCTKS